MALFFPSGHDLKEEISMPQFDNVTVIKPANINFSGKFTSRTLIFANGRKKTLGIMQQREDQFNTTEKD